MMHIAKNIPESRIKELDEFFFDENGAYRLHRAEDILRIAAEDIAVWCHKKAIYGLPTQELVSFLRNEIGDKKAIEIGAGHGYLGESLGIIQTDSYLQLKPKIKAQYKIMGQPIINYPSRVREYEATEAIKRFNPDIVIGMWITQRSKDAAIPQSSPYGINEKSIIKKVDKYIMIGCESQHNMKLIREYPHQVIKADWILSRALDRESNVIYIWDRI